MSEFSKGRSNRDAALYLADSLDTEGCRESEGLPPRGLTQRRRHARQPEEIEGNLRTLGQSDAVAIAEFPDDETGLRVNLAGAMQGYVRGETLRAFIEEEFQQGYRLDILGVKNTLAGQRWISASKRPCVVTPK